MLSETEIVALRLKILEYQPQFEQNRGSDCIPNGIELYKKYEGGLLVWIEELSKIGLPGIALSHLYFFPPDSSEEDIALNLSDKGYLQYPPLNRREALEIGKPKDPGAIRESFFFKITRLWAQGSNTPWSHPMIYFDTLVSSHCFTRMLQFLYEIKNSDQIRQVSQKYSW